MAEPPTQVVAVVRHRGGLLVCDDGVGGGPALPSAPVESAAPEAALEDLLVRLGVPARAVERRGEPVAVEGGRYHPFLVTVPERPTTVGDACLEPRWTAPATLRRGPDDPWWRVYRAVAPTVDSVAADRERGSTAIAVDALWALRDAATAAEAEGRGLESVASVARSLVAARPSMAALATRVDRVMAGATTADEVAAAADRGIVEAFAADATAARLAAETVGDGPVLTLSRSGTVAEALLAARPTTVVLASRPGSEGLAVADDLVAAGLDVTTAPDAAVYDLLRDGDVAAVLVGADAVTADGAVVNKVGTWAAAHAASLANVPCFVVTGADKVRAAPDEGSSADRELEPSFAVEPRFDRTPPGFVTALLTDRGWLEPADVPAVAADHRALTAWRR